MDIHQAKPRINGSMLSKYIGSYVTIVCKTLGQTAGQVSPPLETSDRQRITVRFNQPLSEPLSSYVEIIGRVEQDCSLTVMKYVNWGDDYDIDAYDQVVQLMPQFSALFHAF